MECIEHASRPVCALMSQRKRGNAVRAVAWPCFRLGTRAITYIPSWRFAPAKRLCLRRQPAAKAKATACRAHSSLALWYISPLEPASLVGARSAKSGDQQPPSRPNQLLVPPRLGRRERDGYHGEPEASLGLQRHHRSWRAQGLRRRDATSLKTALTFDSE